jgi:hypothetical protein
VQALDSAHMITATTDDHRIDLFQGQPRPVPRTKDLSLPERAECPHRDRLCCKSRRRAAARPKQAILESEESDFESKFPIRA